MSSFQRPDGIAAKMEDIRHPRARIRKPGNGWCEDILAPPSLPRLARRRAWAAFLLVVSLIGPSFGQAEEMATSTHLDSFKELSLKTPTSTSFGTDIPSSTISIPASSSLPMNEGISAPANSSSVDSGADIATHSSSTDPLPPFSTFTSTSTPAADPVISTTTISSSTLATSSTALPPAAPEPEPVSEKPSADIETLRNDIRREVEEELRAKHEAELHAKIEAAKAEAQKPVEVLREIKNFQSAHGFADGECTLVGESELYCSRKSARAAVSRPLRQSSVFSAATEGDAEIYLREGGRDLQITDNNREDASPAWDPKSGLVVWQTLQSERWKIRGYDRTSGIEFELPEQASNNLNPQVSGNTVVWQAWSGPNWEIMVATKEPNGSWKTARLTENAWPDVSPRISGHLILWQAYENNSWQIMGYDLATRSASRLSRGTGQNQNPRFAVLWESTEGGVSRTMQYDISTGDLAQLPSASPVEQSAPLVPEHPVPVAPLPVSGASTSVSTGLPSQKNTDTPNDVDPLE